MRVLVVGGAGYIGSHTVRRLLELGHEVTCFDNLIAGHAAAVPAGRLIVGDLADRGALDAALRDHEIEAVMHFAAHASVPESVRDPAIYYRNNVVGTLNLLDAMRDRGVGRIVFSSTAAVYGVPESSPISEDAPKNPINPYGFTKLAIERALADYAAAYPIGYAVLRYFNAAGASADGSIGEDHSPESHLIPIILQAALGVRESISVTGTDYPTPDGTCIRDFIHVEDLAEAHCLVLERIVPGRGLTFNVGTGRGYSVREVIEAARRVTGRPIRSIDQPRRPGDPPALVASSDALRRETGWTPRYPEIDAIVATAWRWHEGRPKGYDDRG
ncbi:MAG: UDP-glucose 4-epimerase GalE [Isosphaeraceae bacterium]|nr:UDP-glucose 4-epimerase GalE [Isosphaeraceae bacterium]